MAKGYANGLRKGKQGSTVFYKITNSADKVKQGEREYATQVANPRTASQAAQRLKMTPAVNFYRALKNEILNHSWQGVKYGGRSYAKFMKIVMAKAFSGAFPFVPKGFSQLVPGEYPLSRGSIAPIHVVGLLRQSNVTRVHLNTNYFSDESSLQYTEWVENTIGLSSNLNFGDQITAVAIRLDSSTGIFTPEIRRIVLDGSKYSAGFTAEDLFNEIGLFLSDNELIIGQPNATSTSDAYSDIVAAGVIVSRPSVSQTSGTLSWERSDADLFCDFSAFAGYVSQEAYDVALASYQGAAVDVNSAWYLNQGTTSGSGNGNAHPSPNTLQVNNRSGFNLNTVATIADGGTSTAGTIAYVKGKYVLGNVPVMKLTESGQNKVLTGYVWNAATKQFEAGTAVATASAITILSDYLTPEQAQSLANTFGVEVVS